MKRYIVLRVYPTTLIIYICEDKKIINERRVDLVDLKEHNKRWISNYMNFYRDYEIITKWEDLQFLRSKGIRI